MKALKLMIIAMVLFFSGVANAQVSVNINIGSPPPWGPVGYTEVRYYYLPDVEAYYDIHTSMFIYYGGGVWIHRAYLPVQYENYDLYYGYKVVMVDYRGNTPYVNFPQHKVKYAKGYRGKSQKTISNKPGENLANKPEGGSKKKSSGGGSNKGNLHGGDKNNHKDHGHKGAVKKK